MHARISGHRHTPRWVIVISGILIGVVFPAVPAALAATSVPGSLNCSARLVPVALTDPGPAVQTMWGQLCYRGSKQPSTVQILVSGITYTHVYWNFPYRDGYYSYVDAATAAGYATFDVDRIGEGRSSHPASSDLTIQSAAISLHDAIAALRGGSVSGQPFGHVLWVGHSAGSIIGWAEIARYHDVDAAILTGVAHAINLPNAIQLSEDLYPAAADPLFAGSGLDSGYLTTKPGTRTAFYDTATTDPNVIAVDEATKGTVTSAESATEQSILEEPPTQALSQQVTVPVLVVDGQDDGIYCAGVTAFTCDQTSMLGYESQFYPPQAHLRVAIIPDTGHVLALSATAPLTDAVMLGWARSGRATPAHT